jgi:predicted transcriptional regulator
MTLREVVALLGGRVICGGDLLDTEVKIACGSDLMSDVLAFIKTGSLLLTGLANVQSVRTADVADAKAIVYVRGKEPDGDAIALAEEKGIPLLSTEWTMYEACGKLYQAGLPGGCEYDPGDA